jgi:hypothetical protein
VDFFADPDGRWEFSTLVEMAGFNPEHPGASVGALTEAFDGYPEGSAVITEVGPECRYVAIAQLPLGEQPKQGDLSHSRSGSSHGSSHGSAPGSAPQTRARTAVAPRSPRAA